MAELKYGVDRGCNSCSECDLDRQGHNIRTFDLLYIKPHEYVAARHTCETCRKPIEIGTRNKSMKSRGVAVRYWHEGCSLR